MKSFALLPLVAAVSLSAVAGTPVDESLVVTANRMATPISEVLSPVSVMTAADIERLNISQMSELLSRMASIETPTSGGVGTSTSVYVRGGNTNHTLVLVDGIRINSATLGSTALQHLDVANIERVELVRGPSSSLYGADAVSGVLQIISKQVTGKHFSVSSELGSNDWQNTGVRFGNGNGTTQWSLALGYEELGGFDRTTLDTFLNDDEDSYRNTQLSGNLSHQWSDVASSRFSVQHNDGEIESDNECQNGAYTEVACKPYAEFKQEVYNLDNTWQVTDSLLLKAQLAHSVDTSKNFDDVASSADVAGIDTFMITRKDTFVLQGDYRVSDTLALVLGGEYITDEVESTSAYSSKERDNKAFFGVVDYDLGKHSLQVGLRNDDNEAFGNHTTESVAWGYQLSDSLRVIASWGTAFHAPTFNDLYWPEDPFGRGNPELSPEESENTELALKYSGEKQTFSAAVFKNNIDGLIEWAAVDVNDPWGQWQPSNVDNAQIEGFELDYALTLDKLSATANYTWLDADNENTDMRLINRARRQLNVDLDYVVAAWRYGVSLKARSDFYADTNNTRRYGGYGVVDLRSHYALTPQLNLSATLINLFDKEFTERENFADAGRGFKVGFSYSL